MALFSFEVTLPGGSGIVAGAGLVVKIPETIRLVTQL